MCLWVVLWGELVRAGPWPRQWRRVVAAGGGTVLRVAGVQDAWWEMLPEQARQLPAELARVDDFLDDEAAFPPDHMWSRPYFIQDSWVRTMRVRRTAPA